MSRTQKLDDATLDQAVAQVRSEAPDAAAAEAAAARVWQRLMDGAKAFAPFQSTSEERLPSRDQRDGLLAGAATAAPASATATAAAPQATASAAAAHGPSESIRGCRDFHSLIPAYLAGELSPARALLLEDHTRECLTCRRAVKEARSGHSEPAPAAARGSAAVRSIASRWRSPLGGLTMALAATLALAVGLGVFALVVELATGGADMASVEAVQGDLYRIDGAGVVPVAAGAAVGEGDDIRTAKGSSAVLRLADGSRIEMNERAGLALDAGWRGNIIELDRGQVIVQAAPQRPRRLYVATGDALVSVTGTIFSVNHGTKGSRVSVIEGEVRVAQARGESVLHAGDQVTTHESVERVPIGREIAWSRDRAAYAALLEDLGTLGREIDARLGWPGLRTSTRLLDLAPAGTMVWVGLPNLAANLGETQRTLDERLAENELLREWWSQTMATPESEARFRELIGRVESFGRHLGDEVAVAVTTEGPVGLAEVGNPAALRGVLEDEVARVAAEEGGTSHLRIVDDPAAASGEGIFLWVGEDLFVATPEPALLAEVAAAAAAGGSPFASTPFHGRVAEAYADGAGWLFAADAKVVLAGARARHAGDAGEEAEDDRAEALGILDVEHFVIDHRETAAGGQTLAALSFDKARRGVASWLAAPGPMGSLDFISPDANLAAAFVVKDPTSMLDDLLAAVPEMGEALAELRAEHGLDLREDLAAPLGGEIAFAIDGPLLPKPSWKLIVEVYDPARLQATLKRLASEIGREGEPAMVLTEEVAGGRTWYTLRCSGTGEAAEVHYVYADGYLVAAPSRALLERALQLRAAGATLVASATFRELLPADGQVNFSALVFHNLGEALAPVAGQLERAAAAAAAGAGGAAEGQAMASRFIGQLRPTLAYAYGAEDRILFASSSRPSPLGLNLKALAGFGGIFGMVNGAAGESAEAEDGSAR
jgi:ferric-dicitrate binding protein FerR (iron transport regulator)